MVSDGSFAMNLKTLDVVAGLLDSPCMIKFKELFRRKIE